MKVPRLLVLAGPTAVGKTEASVRLAEILGGEIINADSRQIYCGMDVATSKPDATLRRRVHHHLMDIARPDEVFSAGQYRQKACEIIRRLRARGVLPLVVGGTGLYIRALLQGLWPGPPADWVLRARLMEDEEREGPGHLYRKLALMDPETALRIHPHDRSKTVRALEVALLTGVPLSKHHARFKAEPAFPPAVLIGLRRSREDLHGRIHRRVGEMMHLGLVEEVRSLMRLGYREFLPSMRGLGYRQMAGYLNGLYDLPEAVRLLQRDTRRYAKRQMTWFRKEPNIQWIDLRPEDGAHEASQKILDSLSHHRPFGPHSAKQVYSRTGYA